MQVPLELTFRDVPANEEIRQLVHEKVKKLERYCSYIISCRIVIEKPHKHKHHGNTYRVRIIVRIPPGHEIIAKEEPAATDKNFSMVAVIQKAFDAVGRQIKELVERQDAHVKTHPEQSLQAVVEKLFADENFGFLRSMDGRQIYFHRNSVVDDEFDRLKHGTGVRFVEKTDDTGIHASTVQIIDHPKS